MTVKKISQSLARCYRRENEEWRRKERARRNAWLRDYPGGVNIASMRHISREDFLPAVIKNSRLLGHAVVVTCDDSGTVFFYALPLSSQA